MTTRSVIQKERKTRNIPPLLAGLLSLIAPGLGQIAHRIIGNVVSIYSSRRSPLSD